MLVRVLLFLALPAMLIPSGVCLCHVGESFEEQQDSHDEPLAPAEHDDHDENCPAHDAGQLALVKRSCSTTHVFQFADASGLIPFAIAHSPPSAVAFHVTFVAESPPLYLTLLTLRI